MPTYDYRCTKCGREIEVMHGIHATGPEACEACGSAMIKVLSPPAIHFKGSGWAKKDAAAATSKKAKPKAAAATNAADSTSGSDTKDTKAGSTETASSTSSSTETNSSSGTAKAD